MRDRRASKTAKGVAACRAAEAERPANTRVLDDSLVRKLLGPGWTVLGTSRLPHRIALWLFDLFVPGLQEYLAARARHIDECVRSRVADRTTQLVILGAGYDTRAYRLDGLRDRVRVFEVDHPASQREKKHDLVRVLGALPENVTYVAVDFVTQRLAERLRESGYDERQRTLFVMEGVTLYLDAAAVDATLAFVRGHSGAGSSIVFDYAYPEVIDGTLRHRSAKGLKRAVESAGEPFGGFVIPRGGAKAFLEERGFALLQDADHAALDAAYFSGCDRHACPLFGIAHAAVSAG